MLVIQVSYQRTFWLRSNSRLKAILISLLPVSTALLLRYLLDSQGFKPDWAFSKAARWCQTRSWIHTDTTPSYATVRYAGSALGVALAASSTWAARMKAATEYEELCLCKAARQGFRVFSGVFLGVVTKVVHDLVPKSDANVFYTVEYALMAAMVYLVLVLVPLVEEKVFGAVLPPVQDEAKRRRAKKRNWIFLL